MVRLRSAAIIWGAAPVLTRFSPGTGLIQSHISHPMHSVFDSPVPPPQVEQPGWVSLLRCQAVSGW